MMIPMSKFSCKKQNCFTYRYGVIKQAVHPKGLTLVELMLAISITAVVGLAVATMMTAVTYGTQESKDLREMVILRKVVNQRLTTMIREAQQVLDVTPTSMVVWMADTDGSGTPNISEIRRIEFNPDTNGIVAFLPAPSLVLDTAFELTDNFDSVTNLLITTGSLLEEPWITQANAASFEIDTDDPATARLINYTITLQVGDLTDITINAVALRNAS